MNGRSTLRRLGPRLAALGLAGALIGLALAGVGSPAMSAHAATTFTDGSGSAATQSVEMDIVSSGANIEVFAGQAQAYFTNTTAQASAANVNVPLTGLLGSLSVCQQPPPNIPVPQPISVTTASNGNSQPVAASDPASASATGIRSVSASPSPQANAKDTLSGFALPGLVQVEGGQSASNVTADSGSMTRTAVATSTVGTLSLLGGIVRLEGMQWTAQSSENGPDSTSDTRTSSGSFSLGSIAVGPITLPAATPAQLAIAVAAANTLLATQGVTLKLPAVTPGSGAESVSPLSVVLSSGGTKWGAVIADLLGNATLNQVEGDLTSNLFAPATCNELDGLLSSTGVLNRYWNFLGLAAPLVIGIVGRALGGSGNVTFSIGGASTSLDDTYYAPTNFSSAQAPSASETFPASGVPSASIPVIAPAVTPSTNPASPTASAPEAIPAGTSESVKLLCTTTSPAHTPTCSSGRAQLGAGIVGGIIVVFLAADEIRRRRVAREYQAGNAMSGVVGKGRLRGSESRVLRGYGPVLCVAVAFFVMAYVVPTVAPQQIVSSSTSGSSLSGGTAKTGGAMSSTTTSVPPAGGATAGIGSNGAGSPTTVPAKSQSVGAAASCPGLQIHNDAYSPPCASWAGGNNGGATAQGVTATTVTLGVRETSIFSLVGAFDQISGHQGPAVTSADVIRTYQTLIDFINQHYQFYGRKLQLQVFQGQGSIVNEALGGGQAQAIADAIQEAQQVHAFADVSLETAPFTQALVSQNIIATNPLFFPASFYSQYSPYAWGVNPDCNKPISTIVNLVKTYLAGKPAANAGGSLQGQPRKLGVVYMDSQPYSQCWSVVVQDLQSAGISIDARGYVPDLSTMQSTSQQIANAFASEGITTVIDLADPLETFFMTGTAAEENWYPEWFTDGQIWIDTDWAGQLQNQAEWAHSFGISNLGPTIPTPSTTAYSAYESISPNTTPDELDLEVIWDQLETAAAGIQLAGPDLTPQTFAAGMSKYQSSGTGNDGPWSFLGGTHTAPEAYRITWWNSGATSAFDNEPGAEESNNVEIPFGQLPTGPLPVFTNSG